MGGRMISLNAQKEAFFNEISPDYHNKGFVYYDPEKDQLLHLTPNCLVYFEFNLLWKMFSTAGTKQRRIKTLTEAKEKMNQSGFEYLGEL